MSNLTHFKGFKNPGVIALAFAGFIASQWLIAQTAWWTFSNQDELSGWGFGITYLLFCLFISGVNLMSAWLESPSEVARRWGCFAIETRKDPACIVCCNLLTEILQIRGGNKPQLFLIPSDEVNAFSFQLNLSYQAIFVTRGCLRHLNRTMLKIVLVRQLEQLKSTNLCYSTALSLGISGFCSLFFSGLTLLRYASFGRFERRPEKKSGHPLYFIGLIPLAIGLPSWWISRLMLALIDKDQTYKLDLACINSDEALQELKGIFKMIKDHPHDDMPASTWPFRALGLHNEGFLEPIIPSQPSIEERLAHLASIRVDQYLTKFSSVKAL